MSGFYISKYEDRVEILTDGVIYDDAGTIVSLEKKVWASDHLPMVFVGRRSKTVLDFIATSIEVFAIGKTFDEAFMGFNRRSFASVQYCVT